MKKLYIRRRAIRTAMNENHDPLMNKFPPEIVSHIFMQYSLPSARVDRRYNWTSPLYLGAVCQKWRQLAWTTPELWTSLYIGSHNRDRAQLVLEWLERSASLPLTIRLGTYGEDDADHEVINNLNKHSARWHDMYFDLPASCLHHLSGLSQENILRRLVLSHRASFYPDGSRFSIFSMKSKPSPTDLTLISVGLPYVDIIWNNLTVASVNDIGVDDCLELIRRAPLLETLRLEAINPSSDVFPIPSTRIVHPHLHALELLGIKEETVVTSILDLLCLPSLEQWIHDRSPSPLDNMKSFVRCSSFCLKIFKINIDRVRSHQFTPFLSHLSSLEFLELRSINRPPTEELFSWLCAFAQSPLFLPHLQFLEFSCSCYFPWEFLPQIFTQPRWQSLKVKVNPESVNPLFFDGKVQKLLLELVDQGFDLRVVENGKDWIQESRHTSLEY
jgi:hypothetical protein